MSLKNNNQGQIQRKRKEERKKKAYKLKIWLLVTRKLHNSRVLYVTIIQKKKNKMEVVTIRNREDPSISLFLFQPYMRYFFQEQ